MMYCFSRVFSLFTLFALSGSLVSIPATGFALARLQTQQQNISITTNEGAAMKSLRTLFAAEATFQNTIGKGEYGKLGELGETNLIDKGLASGLKQGYRFTVVVKKTTMSTQPAFDLLARPVSYGKNNRRSFYLTESGVMLTSEEKNSPLTSMRPFAIGNETAKNSTEQKSETTASDESTSEEMDTDVSTNEASVKSTLSTVHAAEEKYAAKVGAGNYGTLAELEKAGLLDKMHSASSQNGYLIEVKIDAAQPNSPGTYSISAVPQTYGVSGRTSFFLDQSGVIRGDDKEGGPAGAADPIIK